MAEPQTKGEDNEVRFGSITASEAGRRSGEVRARKRAERLAKADEAKLTARQRLAMAAAAELTVDDWRAILRRHAKEAASGDSRAIHALARLYDQAFGKANPTEDESSEVAEWEAMSPAQRSTYRASLLRELEQDGRPMGDESDPRS